MENLRPNDAIRTARYYCMQTTFEELYESSKKGKIVKDLYSLIQSPRNIKLAYRRIKTNSGNNTSGVDKQTIQYFKEMEEEEFVTFIQKKLENYQPSEVKRVYIPKPNGKERPLGIPTMEDRICQQCVRQVIEPICEARFSKHSHGFRPLEGCQSALADVYSRIQHSHYYWAISLDIKGFFDNVNHRRLRQALWGIGIQDTRVLQIIMKMVKADIKEPNGDEVKAEKGTPQGGIISPLLANVYLNCLDQWLTDQWETFDTHMTKPPKKQYNKNGERNMSHEYRALKKSKLKEFAFVRYADDVVILCTSLQSAKKLKIAIQDFLAKDLKLEISEEKTKIADLRKSRIKYLGYLIGTQSKGSKYVVESHIRQEAIDKIKGMLVEQIKKIQKPNPSQERWSLINRYNSMVMGIHNYYKYATHASCDLSYAGYLIGKVMENRLHPTRKGKIEQKGLQKYGKSDQVRYLEGRPLIPIGYIPKPEDKNSKKSKKVKKGKKGKKGKKKKWNPMFRKVKENIYTPEGVEYLEQYENYDIPLLELNMLQHPVRGRSMEYNDNRHSLVSGQRGKDKVTGEPLQEYWIDCHHIKPVSQGGDDSYNNLILVHPSIHILIHATDKETILRYVFEQRLDEVQIQKLNKYRKLAGNLELKIDKSGRLIIPPSEE
ncbi:MAG: group II intron reverse transcriptase/maturase [Allobaculum sp.]|nr:group II intron reverse transcriptase/maturase [Allobaculum sp.]